MVHFIFCRPLGGFFNPERRHVRPEIMILHFFGKQRLCRSPKSAPRLLTVRFFLHYYPNQNLVVFRRMEGPMVVLRYRDFT